MNLTLNEVEDLVKITRGYSGADLKNLSVEAAMIPLRSISDIASVDIGKIRPTELQDFKAALKNVKASVNGNDLKHF